jgi:hypothetical protein
MKKWDPVDVIVLCLVFIVGFVLVFGEVKETFMKDSPEAIKNITHIIGGLTTIIGTYVGFKLGKKSKDNE